MGDATFAAQMEKIMRLWDENRRLRQIIRDYARHNEGCSAAHGDQYRCRCGWRDVAPEFTAEFDPVPERR